MGDNGDQKVAPKLGHTKALFTRDHFPFIHVGNPKGSLSYYNPLDNSACYLIKGNCPQITIWAKFFQTFGL